MGKLTITGKAEKECAYDRVEISVKFDAYGDSSAKAIEKVLGQCEDFLKCADAAGIPMENIHLGMDGVGQDCKDHRVDAHATRAIKICIPFNMELVNYLMALVKDNHYDVEIESDYRLSDKSAIHDDLIKAAIADSKEKAGYIATAMDQKVMGVDTIVIGNRYDNRLGRIDWDYSREIPIAMELRHSNQLQSPVTVETESVDVVWIIG